MKSSKAILLVEDDRIDAMTVKRALKDLKVTNKLVHKENGREALDFLKAGENGNPCVILLDLNMPEMGGIDFIHAIKAEEGLKKIPIVVLTTSDEEQDVIESFNLGVAGYIIKPVDYKKFVESIRIIDLYWTLSKLPNGG